MGDISRDSVIRFLSQRGGRVSNQQLLEHFRPLLTAAPPGEARAAARQLFKDTVNEVASVRAEDGVKYVCLRKKYRRAAETGPDTPSVTEQPGQQSVEEGSPDTPSVTEQPGQQSVEEGSPEPSSGEDTGDAASTPEPSDETPEEPPPDSGPGEETGDESPESRGSPGYAAPPRISITEEPGEDDGERRAAGRRPPDVLHLSGRTPRNSRRGIRDPVSPQLRRGGVLLRAGLRDSDSSSLHSSSSVSGNEEEEGGGGAGSVSGSAALEPLEHAWMVSSCRARWDGLQELLLAEPGLITRRDFITGFSCLHWAAKHGQHELLAALLTHARQHRVPVNINARASGGYTALHLAAMHGHLDVIKLLVGAYDADLDVRDYSGRKAWQYLSPDTARDVQALVGALPAAGEEEDGGSSGPGRWRLSRVLPSQLIVHRLSQLPEDEQDCRADISRKGSGRADISRKGSGRPRINKIRFRTQIIHSNLRDPGEEDDSNRLLKSPGRHRPKSNVFG
ncbi:ankyrin repeat domain-containing protein SOWAHC [Dendropsophus ebraccatus]|uniref:ankyrin repeat domain-containing protein SOWAHC n=1 Tax=Dendropsophus ebraccatus TaxID=150705 RepID=UPI0038321DC1